MIPIDDREFEPVLRDAMRARPQPRSISNLAFRAMELAGEQARALARRQLESLVRLRRRTMWVGMISAVLIAVVVWIGAVKMVASGIAQSYSSTTSTSSNPSASDTSSSTSSSFSPAVILTAELLAIAMILLSASIPSPQHQTP